MGLSFCKLLKKLNEMEWFFIWVFPFRKNAVVPISFFSIFIVSLFPIKLLFVPSCIHVEKFMKSIYELYYFFRIQTHFWWATTLRVLSCDWSINLYIFVYSLDLIPTYIVVHTWNALYDYSCVFPYAVLKIIEWLKITMCVIK